MADEADAPSLDELHAHLVGAVQSNDATELGRCFSKDAVLLPWRGAMVAGNQGIAAFWSAAKRVQALAFKTTRFAPIGDEAFLDSGTLVITFKRPDRSEVDRMSKYMATWVAEDGAWKIDSLAWNSVARARKGQGRGPNRQGRKGGPGAGRGRRGGAEP